MSWVRLDDTMPDNLKIEPLSDAAFRAYVTSICYAARNLTDGFVTNKKAKEFAGKSRVIQELVPDLWGTADGGYVIHDFLKYNPTRDSVLKKRAADSARKNGGILAESYAPRVRDPRPDPDPDPDPQIELPVRQAGAREKRLDAIAADFAAFGLVNSGTARAIEESVADFDLDVVDLAVKRARSSGYEGKPPWSYVESILERWKKQGGPDEPKETRNGRTQTTQRAATGRGRSATTSEADMVDEWKRYAAGQD